jgi:glyoxylase-like metal-dependent hydrolase (beta-lactamase superfamily II)
MEIASGVYSMSQLKGAFVHAFLLDVGDGLMVIDTLFDNDAKRVLDQIRRIGKDVSDLKRIVLTHAHRSHLGGLAELKRLSGAPVYAHPWEMDIISGDRRSQCVSWRPQRPLVTYPLQVGLNLGLTSHKPCAVDHTLQDGDQVGPLQVLHTPGHSPGHLAFYWPERKVLITGDAVVNWPKLTLGWPGFMLNFKQQRDSVRRMAALESEVLAMGHGDPVTSNGGERLRALVGQEVGGL